MRLVKPHCWLLPGLLLLTAAVWSQDVSPKKSPVLVFSTPAATAAAAAFYARPQGSAEAVKPPEAVPPQTSDPLVIRGEYLARAGDCISCHTRAQGAPFAGGLPLKTPFGTIVSTNITPDRALGIGNYTLEDFIRVMRRGKARDGHYIYPAMPYTNFSRLADDDLRALYTYFMKGVRPVSQDNAMTDLLWPFSLRWLMAGWNLLYLPDKPFQSDAVQSEEWNRGAYLVQGLGHCSACHTPRSLAGGEKASTEKDGDVFLSGALIDGWYAPALRSTGKTGSAAEAGLASWKQQDIVDYLKTGRATHTAAFGPMAEVVGNSTQYMSRPDLSAIATYLKGVGGEAGAPAASGGTVKGVVPSRGFDASTTALRSGDVAKRGSLIYLNNCGGCHRSDGQGSQRTFPALGLSSAVVAKDPTSLIRIVLQGSAMPHTVEAPSALAMPGFGWRLGDNDVADVLTFVRSSWGNSSEPVGARSVEKVRREIAKSVASK